MEFIIWYISIAFAIAVANAIVAGFRGMTWTITDIIDSFVWPLSIAVLVGQLLKLSVDKYNERLEKRPTQPTKAKGIK